MKYNKKNIIYSLILLFSILIIICGSLCYVHYGIYFSNNLLKFYSKYDDGFNYYYDSNNNAEVLTSIFYVKSNNAFKKLSGTLKISGKFYSENKIIGGQIISFNNEIKFNLKNIKWDNVEVMTKNNSWDNNNIFASNKGIEYDLMYFNNNVNIFIFASLNGYYIYNFNFFILNSSFFFVDKYENNIKFSSKLWT